MTQIITLGMYLIAYLMGSVCSAILVSKLFSLPDPRENGSKNPGATNVLRLSGKQYAVYTLLGDVLKGTVPVLLAKIIGLSVATVGFVAFFAVIGHMYPVYFEFKGGKGVGTTLGAFLGLNLFFGIMMTALWVLVASFSRYSSLASITTVSIAPFIGLMMVKHVDIFPPLMLITLFVLFKHKDNIARLLNGEESKIALKNKMGSIDDAMNEVIKLDDTGSHEK